MKTRLCLALAVLLPALVAVSAAESQEIAITIDDPDVNADDTPRLSLDQRNDAILDTLRRRQLKAALFVTGMRVDNETGRRHLGAWDAQGHLLGNHSYSHLMYPTAGFEKFSSDVLRGQKVIEKYPNFRKWFRFPYLKEGATPQQRDAMRKFLSEHGYRMGHVTIDASDWAIDARLRKRLGTDPQADLRAYRDFYLEHIWDRAQFYDGLARRTLQRPVKHTLLIHHNLLNALFLDDLLAMFEARGWRLIDAAVAFQDPVFREAPNIAPAGESILWALAQESKPNGVSLRYPAENDTYENPRMDALGL